MRIWTWLLAATLLLSGLACGEEKTEEPERVRPVRYQEVFSAGSKRERSFSGVARSGTESRLSFRVPGTVEDVSVTVGQQVRSSAVIARLNEADYRLKVQEAESALAQARAAERNAKAGYERVRGMYENDNASLADLDASRAQAESAEAQVKTVETRLAQARRQLSYATLQAPMDGAIASVLVAPNENVQAGQGIVVLTAGSRPEVEVAIPEALIGQIDEGDIVDVTFDAIPDETYPAVVTEVGVATGRTAAYPVVVRLESEDSSIRSGMAAEVLFRFESEGNEEQIFVPAVAVGEDRDGRYVFVLEPGEDGTAIARRREVVVGELTTDGLEIREGLSDGELIATAGVRRLEEGTRVRLQDGSGA